VILTILKTFPEESITLWAMMPDEVIKGVDTGIDQLKKEYVVHTKK
jgi:hypothetical protein